MPCIFSFYDLAIEINAHCQGPRIDGFFLPPIYFVVLFIDNIFYLAQHINR